ncbi:MAG: hypothetical protein HXX08_14720 [Chloroflexi bacterium]|uniref:RcpC/CpaB family pilus assembly protein n=1 Tax=Candidatus Chlorohelix allophototropha TaxID=3003348 RepID=A0A8T7M4S9_9CHLR|nr:hypothetical protein [Chloroflexota bacterium]WJW70270.1 RcpC/CpaB family pilus assembly protein [Chloroflexota bacterium L227-S17]
MAKTIFCFARFVRSQGIALTAVLNSDELSGDWLVTGLYREIMKGRRERVFNRKEQSQNGNSHRPPDLEEFDPTLTPPVIEAARSGHNGHTIPDFGNGSRVKPSVPLPRREIPSGKTGRVSGKPVGGTPTQDSRWRLLLGLGIAVMTFLAALFWLQGSVEGVEVVVATREIATGQIISADDLTTARLSGSSDYASRLIASKELSGLTRDGSERKVAARLIRAAEPLMKQDLIPASQYNRSGIPEGQVALSLPTTSAYAVSRISRGDQVTLLITNKSSGSDAKNQAIVLAENIKVLEVARSGSSLSLNSSSSGAGSSNSGALSGLTLLVTLEQARQISQAREQGVITVVLQPLTGAAEGLVTISPPATEAAPVTTVIPVGTITPTGGQR